MKERPGTKPGNIALPIEIANLETCQMRSRVGHTW